MRLLVVDDHEIVRVGLRAILSRQPGWEVVGEAANSDEAVRLARETSPDVVLMDVRLPDRSGTEACREILSDNPEIKVLMLTSYPDEEAVYGSVLAGASGYVLKDIGSENLLQAIVRVHRGESLLDPVVTRSVLGQLRTWLGEEHGKTGPAGAAEALTEREDGILRLIGEGLTNRQIAERLYLSEKTVRNHVSHVLAKLDLRNRVQLAVYSTTKRPDGRR